MKTRKLSIDELEERIAQTARDLNELRKQRAAEAAEAHEVIQKAQYDFGKLHNSWTKRKNRVNISNYAEAMTNQSQRLVPRMVVTQQAHLCRNLHWMEIHDAQLKLIEEHNRIYVMFMKAQIAAMNEELSEVERIGMNKILKMDMDIRMTREEHGIEGGSRTPVWQGSLGKPLSRIQEEPGNGKRRTKKKKTTFSPRWSSHRGHHGGRSMAPPSRLTHSLRGLFTLSKRAMSPKPRLKESVVKSRVYSRRGSYDVISPAR